MKSTGIVRKVDELGRIVLPMEIRKVMDIKEKDAIEIFTEADQIILQKYQPACIFCDSAKYDIEKPEKKKKTKKDKKAKKTDVADVTEAPDNTEDEI